jgi:xylulokinase
MDRSQMPRLVEGSAPSATLHTQLAQRWDMPAGVVVAGGAGDNAASAVGMGLVDEGQGFVSLGTSGVIFVSGRAFRPNPTQALHAFCHALPQRWHQMSVMLSAASAITWAARQLGFASEAELLQSASTLGLEPRAQAPLFTPYLSGERSPHNNAHACASWTGLRSAHQRADLAYAVAEGVALGLRGGWQSFGPQTGVESLSLVGGGSRSAWWAQLISCALQTPLTLHQDSAHGATLGAARLGWLACGADEHSVCLGSPVLQTLEPEPDAIGVMHERNTRFTAVYAALHPN